MNRRARLFAIVEYMRGRRSVVTAEALAERFAVTVRTIYREARSHYRPFRDTWVTSWLSVHYKTTGSDRS